jgi:regulator of CtrA degradation
MEARSVSVSAQPTAFFNKTYDETLGLLTEMRDYVAHGEARDRAKLAPLDSARLCCASLRVTARLTQVMAWLLTQKAVHAGEMTTSDLVASNGRLAEIAVCMEEESEGEIAGLPTHFRTLLERSHRLYLRVARLDDMVRKQAG